MLNESSQPETRFYPPEMKCLDDVIKRIEDVVNYDVNQVQYATYCIDGVKKVEVVLYGNIPGKTASQNGFGNVLLSVDDFDRLKEYIKDKGIDLLCINGGKERL